MLISTILSHQREVTDERQYRNGSAQDQQIYIPALYRRDPDAERILIGKQKIHPEVDMLKLAVEIGRRSKHRVDIQGNKAHDGDDDQTAEIVVPCSLDLP